MSVAKILPMPMSTIMPMVPAVSITTIAMTMMRDPDDSDGDDDDNDDNEDNDNDDNDNDDDYREDNDEHEGDEDDENQEKRPFLAQKSEQVFNEIWRVIWGSVEGREGCVLYKDSHCFWRREETKNGSSF